jgi:1,4-dihydroxy-6-naphthoate synthase
MTQLIRIGHSPDADDAFMFYAMTHGKVTIPGVRIEHVLEDIESLNRRAGSTELEVTAVSCATYPCIADRYRLMDPGASMGKGYGPIVVAREPMSPEALAQRVIAIPGYGTTAYLLLRLALGDPPVIVVAFDQIPRVVADGQADAGLLIHEGQITYGAMGLFKVLDMGELWTKRTGLPLPLGVNVTRRDLGGTWLGACPRRFAPPSAMLTRTPTRRSGTLSGTAAASMPTRASGSSTCKLTTTP